MNNPDVRLRRGRSATPPPHRLALELADRAEVLDAQRTMAEARIAHLAALSDLNGFAAELEKLIGSEIGGR